MPQFGRSSFAVMVSSGLARRFDRRRRSEVAGDCFGCDGDGFQCPIFGVLASVGWPRSIDVRGHDHRFWPGWERLITRIGKAYLHPSRPCRKPECHRKVGGSGRETGARDVSDCRCEQRPPLSQNRDLSTRPASCPMMAADAVQRVSWSRAETKRRRSVVRSQVRVGGAVTVDSD